MMLLPILVCLFALLQASLASPIAASKRKTVDLSYSCMRVTGKDAKKDDIPVILLHGLGLSKESWMGIYQLLALKTGKRVCIADLRNHGDSPWSNETDIDAMAEDINRLVDKLKAPKAVVFGHSLGGKVAIHFTLNHPTKVDKLIVEDMRPNGLTPQALLEIKFSLTLIAKATSVMPEVTSEKEAKAAVLKFINDELIKVNSSELLDSRAAAFLPIKCSEGKCRWKTNMQLISEVVKNPLALLTKSSGQFDGSTLFVYGTVSPFKIYEDESSIKKLFPNAKLVGIKGASHMVHIRPEFLDVVIKFINGI
ncbi:protein ABHD11 [Caerostris extrusa]|uniref:sn-1-specific diacylglycerol lipase ABHD11 n=1 Tax=Caerostris extrusa TaxID=172846 RepID=A0AAV4UA84_CAEEX|nr:protein ABHD11 [Caerostris extrusa]